MLPSRQRLFWYSSLQLPHPSVHLFILACTHDLNPLVTVAIRDLGTRNSLLDSLLNVRDQVGGVFDTAGDSDEVVEDTGDFALLLGDTGVGH